MNILYFIRKNGGVLIALCVLLIIVSCSFQEPATPNWNVDLQLPLIARRYTMHDLSEEIDELNINASLQEVLLNISQDFETFEIGERLKIEGASRSVVIPVNGSITDFVEIPDSIVVVDTAAVGSGIVTLNLVNQGYSDVDVIFDLPEITSENGMPLHRTIMVPGNGSVIDQFSLAGYKITPPVVAGKNRISFSGSISNSNGDVNVDVTIGELTFSYISGVLNRLEVEIDSTEADLNIPEALEDFALERVSLKLAVRLGLQLPVSIDLRVEGHETKDGSNPVIAVQGTLNPLTEVDTLEIPDVAAFINAMPRKVKISGKFSLGDGLTKTRITNSHVINTTGIFEMPMIFTLPTVDTKIDVDTLEIDADAREILEDNLVEAHFIAELENGLPVGGEVTLFFSRLASEADSTIFDLDTLDNSLDHWVFPIPFHAGIVGTGNPAVVQTPTENLIRIDLTSANLPLFYQNETLYFGIKIESDQSGAMVKVRPSDFIDIKAYISAKINTTVPESNGEGGA